jgi:hypothetical protein
MSTKEGQKQPNAAQSLTHGTGKTSIWILGRVIEGSLVVISTKEEMVFISSARNTIANKKRLEYYIVRIRESRIQEERESKKEKEEEKEREREKERPFSTTNIYHSGCF